MESQTTDDEPGMKISDLVRAGGGTADAAYGGTAELTRYTVAAGESRNTELIQINLSAALQGDASADAPLQPFDRLSVKQIPLWGQQESVTLLGEVRFPGKYVIRRGETLKQVIDRIRRSRRGSATVIGTKTLIVLGTSTGQAGA